MALRGAPIPDGEIQRGHGGSAKILELTRVCSVTFGVYPIPVVQADGGKVACARGVDILGRSLDGGKCRANLGILVSHLNLKFIARGQRDAGMEVVRKLKIVAEIREDENCKVEPRVQQGELRFLQLASA